MMMTGDKIRFIFSRFQNLNLIVLIEDMKRGLVATRRWMTCPRSKGMVLCPIAHGWTRFAADEDDRVCYLRAGIAENQRRFAERFVSWWDKSLNKERFKLLAQLEVVYHERLEDADAVQEITAPAIVREKELIAV